MTVFTIDPGYDQELQELEEFTSKSEIHPLTVEFLTPKVQYESLIVLVGKKQLFQISKFVSIAEIKGKNSINRIYGYEDTKFCILDPLDPNLQLIPEIFYSLSEKLLVIEVQSGSPNDDNGCIFLSTKTKMDLGFATCNSVSARILTFADFHDKECDVYLILQNGALVRSILQLKKETGVDLNKYCVGLKREPSMFV